MAREMVAMWRTANGLVGVPGQLSHQASDELWNPVDLETGKPDGCVSGWRKWIPSLERTPPLWQFIVRLARWWKVKFHAVPAPSRQLRLVGQLALGAKRHLSLVEVGGAQFLVGGGVEDISVIIPVQAPKVSECLQDTSRPDAV